MMRLRSYTMEPATTAHCEVLNATGEISLSARSVPVCVSPMTPDGVSRDLEKIERGGSPMTTSIDPRETGVTAPEALATSATVTTTLYDLIATIQDIVGPGNDRLVVATVVHMLSAGARMVPRALDMQSSTVLSSVADC
jgi:hypothetical protein